MGRKETAAIHEIAKPPQSSASSSRTSTLPPPLPKCWAAMSSKATNHQASASTWSVTKKEIDKYWTRKRMEEEDHLFAAIKSVARIRARNLTEEDYRKFEESLKERKMEEEDNYSTTDQDENNKKEIRVGIKDWWTKSKYAYLNQPEAIKKGRSRRASSYKPDNCLALYNYKPPATLIY